MNLEEEYHRMACTDGNVADEDSDTATDSLYKAAERLVSSDSEATKADSYREREGDDFRAAASAISDTVDANDHNGPNELAACLFALLSGVCHALSLAVNTELGAKVGKDELYLQFFGASFAFLSYHLFRGMTWYISGHGNAYWHQYYDKTTSLLGES